MNNGQHPDQHPIEGLMQTAMESIKSMVNVNTILGEPVETADGTVIVPVSRVSLGFGAGGSEFQSQGNGQGGFPFGGGSGAGISLNPVAFLVVGGGEVRLLPIDDNAIFDRLLDMAPRLLEQVQGMMGQGSSSARRNGNEEIVF